MLTLEDCIALSELTAEEVAAIAAHEHCHEIVAAELGQYLVATADGRVRIREMIRDDLVAASNAGDFGRTALLKTVLKRFIAAHPEGCPSQ